MADFGWDPRKESLNFRKHQIDFTTASLIWNGHVMERIDNRRNYGEVRFQAFGVVNDHVLTVIYTWRGETRRIISARRANVREKDLFTAELSKQRPAPQN
jgi:uncharacterized DUF497 family protein